MVWVDVVFLAIIVVSTLFATMRGFVREAISLLGWIVALWAAFTYAEIAAGFVPVETIGSETLRLAIGFVGVFIAVLIVSGMANMILGKLVDVTGMDSLDKLLSVFFGAARGILVVVIAILLVKLTPFSNMKWWEDSEVVPMLEPLTSIAGKYANDLFSKNWGLNIQNNEEQPAATPVVPQPDSQ